MFACDHCQYMAVSKEILKIHFNHLHRDLIYTWDKNASRKVDLEMSEQTIHEGKKYLCKECDHRTASKGNLAQH